MSLYPTEEEIKGVEETLRAKEKLTLVGLNISEACRVGCIHCAPDITSLGKMMDWNLVEALLTHPDIKLGTSYTISGITRPAIALCDGEVLIYRSGERTLVDVLEKALSINNLGIAFTTRGLVRANRKLGLEVLRFLSELSPEQAKRFSISLSFNLFHLRSQNEDSIRRYVDQVLETCSFLKSVGDLNVMYSREIGNEENGVKTRDAYNMFFERLLSVGVCGVDVFDQPVGPAGRALKHFNFKEDYNGICDLYENVYGTWDLALMGVRADGRVYAYCDGFGTRGVSIGTVYENDVPQIHEGYIRFLIEHRNRLHTLKGRHVCEFHRTWGKEFTAPRAKKPLIVRAR